MPQPFSYDRYNPHTFQALGPTAHLAPALLKKLSMTLEISPRMLGEISTEVERGRAVFALLRVREYLDIGHPIFHSLAIRAKKRISDPRLQLIISKLENGATFGDLSPDEIELIQTAEQSHRKFKRPIMVPNYFKRRAQQRALRFGAR